MHSSMSGMGESVGAMWLGPRKSGARGERLIYTSNSPARVCSPPYLDHLLRSLTRSSEEVLSQQRLLDLKMRPRVPCSQQLEGASGSHPATPHIRRCHKGCRQGIL